MRVCAAVEALKEVAVLNTGEGLRRSLSPKELGHVLSLSSENSWTAAGSSWIPLVARGALGRHLPFL